ncbi:MAG: hypothetical protein LC104_22075 [Bacteroidales bacterium]|nr:hypothetical protein [Bacteroidales bacterium]
MRFIDPEILRAGQGLSLGGAGFLLAVGLLLWACGWRWHRFWVVFGITLAAGIIGLTAGRSAGSQVMVVGVLLAVTAGLLALELARILAFLTGGTAAWFAAQFLLPGAHELWAVFLSGGLLGIVLYRFWTILATSFLGSLMTVHAGLMLAVGWKKGFDAEAFATEQAAALNGLVITAGVIGVLVQAKLLPQEHAKTAQADTQLKVHKPQDSPTPADTGSAPSSAASASWTTTLLPGKHKAA